MDLEALKQAAAQVASEAHEAELAHADLRSAETKLLSTLVELTQPALRALSSRPVVSSATTWHGAETDTVITRADWRGLYLGNGRVGPEQDHPRDNAGLYEGTDLFLRDDGQFVELTYEGRWSRWQGAGEHWTAHELLRSPEQVAAEYDVDSLAESLSAAVQKALGTRTKSAKAATERANKLKALTVLL